MDIIRNGLMATAAFLCLGVGVAHAKLPPLTAPEQEAAAQKKTQAAAEVEEQKAALNKVQDQIAARYIAEQQAKGITVTPTPLASAPTAAAPAGTEVPAAALEQRSTEKAGAYNQAETTTSARTSATVGSSAEGTPPSAPTPNEQKK